MAKKAKGSSFSKSNTKAGTAAYNTKRKVEIAKKELEAKKKEIKAAEKNLARNVKNLNYMRSGKSKIATPEQRKALASAYESNVEYYAFDALPRKKSERSAISQNVSDRSRSASRAAGIAKRVAKKGK